MVSKQSIKFELLLQQGCGLLSPTQSLLILLNYNPYLFELSQILKIF